VTVGISLVIIAEGGGAKTVFSEPEKKAPKTPPRTLEQPQPRFRPNSPSGQVKAAATQVVDTLTGTGRKNLIATMKVGTLSPRPTKSGNYNGERRA
jgi:hypothetical protein